jgi:hypothetical protein
VQLKLQLCKRSGRLVTKAKFLEYGLDFTRKQGLKGDWRSLLQFHFISSNEHPGPSSLLHAGRVKFHFQMGSRWANAHAGLEWEALASRG